VALIDSPTQFAETLPPVELAGVEVLRPTRPRAARPALVAESAEQQSFAPQAAIAPPPQAAPVAPPPANRMVQRHQQILDMFNVIALVLAVRLLLFLSLTGAFILALQAMDKETIPAIVVLVCYALLTVGPLVYLEVRGKPRLGN
jgi:hypothetical protein